ncbi:YabP/YqfC family sporulation protein [Oscillospiraceae bacterium LCP25S3_E10]|nr:YabP/YqfC family sporulation protein [Ruminococcus sp.]MDD6447816.1 YabP/YqfC family sporulation protein [Ruminococcus sp.]MDY2855581.1 YabP/YqfC family sporulation protein [Oscillospiraceae bacterium]
MQQEKQNQRPKIPHSVIIENRASISFTGVRDMGSFDEQAVVLYTDYGEINLRGSKLHINKLSLDTNEVDIDGNIEAVVYTQNKQSNGLFGKLFR